MGGVLLKKKKKIIVKKHFKPRVWRTVWANTAARFFKKKLKRTKRTDLLKKKSKVSPHKKYKLFKARIDAFERIRCVGDALPKLGLFGFSSPKATIVNFSTLIGMRNKFKGLGKNINIIFKKFPTLLLTRKSTGHRMGKGKGKFSARIAKFKAFETVFETGFVDKEIHGNRLKAIAKALPGPSKIVVKSNLFLDHLKKTNSEYISNFKRPFKKTGRRFRGAKRSF